MQTQKKVDNLNDILKHKISYLNRKQKNKSNINEQNIKVNLKKTTPIKFLLNELLIKQKKSKMNKLPHHHHLNQIHYHILIQRVKHT